MQWKKLQESLFPMPFGVGILMNCHTHKTASACFRGFEVMSPCLPCPHIHPSLSPRLLPSLSLAVLSRLKCPYIFQAVGRLNYTKSQPNKLNFKLAIEKPQCSRLLQGKSLERGWEMVVGGRWAVGKLESENRKREKRQSLPK